eukprot:4333741-Heterocapsa_arctica.AAC.1
MEAAKKPNAGEQARGSVDSTGLKRAGGEDQPCEMKKGFSVQHWHAEEARDHEHEGEDQPMGSTKAPARGLPQIPN